MAGIPTPSYDLTVVQGLVAQGEYRVTLSALNAAGDLCLDRADIKACLLGLTLSDFYKTMAAEQAPGLMQDVYRPTYLGIDLYVKLQLDTLNRVVVISFKER